MVAERAAHLATLGGGARRERSAAANHLHHLGRTTSVQQSHRGAGVRSVRAGRLKEALVLT
jgi:hypothetical protein